MGRHIPLPSLGLGNRGRMMILLAVLYLWVAAGIVIVGPAGVRDGLIHTLWPTWLRVIEWALPALVAIVFAWRKRDSIGWVALLIPPMIRGLSYVYGGLVWVISDGTDGYRMGFWNSALYLFIIGVVVLSASWPDFPARPKPPGGDDEPDEVVA